MTESLPNPGFNPDTRSHEVQAAEMALRLSIYHAVEDARRLNNDIISTLRAGRRPTFQRYIIEETKSLTRPATEEVIPADANRVVMVPNMGDATPLRTVLHVQQQEAGLVLNTPQWVVIERVHTDYDRDCYLLNGDGLWRMQTSADLNPDKRLGFRVADWIIPEDPDVMLEISADLESSAPGVQTALESY